jgi:hypothetical protein
LSSVFSYIVYFVTVWLGLHAVRKAENAPVQTQA